MKRRIRSLGKLLRLLLLLRRGRRASCWRLVAGQCPEQENALRKMALRRSFPHLCPSASQSANTTATVFGTVRWPLSWRGRNLHLRRRRASTSGTKMRWCKIAPNCRSIRSAGWISTVLRLDNRRCCNNLLNLAGRHLLVPRKRRG